MEIWDAYNKDGTYLQGLSKDELLKAVNSDKFIKKRRERLSGYLSSI